MERGGIQRSSMENSARFGPGHRERTAQHKGGAEKRSDSHGNASRPQMLALAQARESVALLGRPSPAESIRSIDPCAPYLHLNATAASTSAGN